MKVIQDISYEKFKEYRNDRVPVLIKNGLKYFPKLKEWSLDIISSKYPNVKCKYSGDSRPVRSKLVTSYSDFCKNKSNKYYTFTRTKYNCLNKTFIEDFNFPNVLFNENDIDKHIFFAGPENTGALPHKHGDALNFLVSGTKKWVLFDAIQGCRGNDYQNYYYRKYPAKHKSLEWFDDEYEKLKFDSNIIINECFQESNDIVYIPRHFSHTTLNQTDVLGIVIELFVPPN